MIPITWQFPINFTPKKYTSKLNFEKNKISIPERRLWFGLKMENDHFGMLDGIFFFLEKKLIIVFFGVKFTGDYRNVEIIPILCRDHRQKSRNPNFS